MRRERKSLRADSHVALVLAGRRPLRSGGVAPAVAAGRQRRGAEALSADIGAGGRRGADPRRPVHPPDSGRPPADRRERAALPPRHGGFGDRHRHCRPRRAHPSKPIRPSPPCSATASEEIEALTFFQITHPDDLQIGRETMDRHAGGHGQRLPLRKALPQEGRHAGLGPSCRLRHSRREERPPALPRLADRGYRRAQAIRGAHSRGRNALEFRAGQRRTRRLGPRHAQGRHHLFRRPG